MAAFAGISGAVGCAVSGETSLGGASGFGSLVVGSGVTGVDRQALRDNTAKTHSNPTLSVAVFDLLVSVWVRFPVMINQPNLISAIFVPR
jgi:hypothetical protein